MTKKELLQKLQDLQHGNMSLNEMYHVIREFGRENFLEARQDVERFLTHPDPKLRGLALEVLAVHWGLTDSWYMARAFLEQDPDEECRMRGALALEVLKRNIQDRDTLLVLARVVCYPKEASSVRQAAYAAMLGIIHFDPQEQLSLAEKGLDLDQEIDWNMVKSYLSESSDLSADSQKQGENVVKESTPKKLLPPDLLALLRTYRQWTLTQDKEIALFSGMLVGDLLKAGHTSAAILDVRYRADELLHQKTSSKTWESMLFTSETTKTDPFFTHSLSESECQQVCDALSTMRWEEISNSAVFQVLYPGVPWLQWMFPFVGGGKRAILDWAVHHWETFEEIFSSTLLVDEWNIAGELDVSDLSNGIATDPWQIVRQIAWQQALNEESPVKQYPPSPWGNASEITQLRSSVEAQYEEIFFHCSALMYLRDYACYLERGFLFLYHIGPPLPNGSIALIASNGRVWRHDLRAGEAADRERRLLQEWLASFGAGGESYRWPGCLPRKVFDKQQILQQLHQAGIARVVWDINWFADDTQCTVLACFTEEDKQVPLPQPLDDADFWCLITDKSGKLCYSGTYELLVQQESISPLDKLPEPFTNRWNWTEE
jgi:hypothetical protein